MTGPIKNLGCLGIEHCHEKRLAVIDLWTLKIRAKSITRPIMRPATPLRAPRRTWFQARRPRRYPVFESG